MGEPALWMAHDLLAAGLTVIETDGWEYRQRPNGGGPNYGGVLGHHTAGPSTGELPSLRILRDGRSDLPGPICNVGLARSGAWYLIAAGVANHAGLGYWQGLRYNADMLGIEAENDGTQPWPDAQLQSYIVGSAVLLRGLGRDESWWARHHEWRAEKPDPHDIDGDWMRAQIGAALAALDTPPPPPDLSVYRRNTMDLSERPGDAKRVDLVIVGADNAIYHIFGATVAEVLAKQSTDYEPLGGWGKAVSGTWTDDGSTYVVTTQGKDDAPWFKTFTFGPGWSEWVKGPGLLAA